MAITLNMNWRGVNIPNAYVRIDHTRGGKRENRHTPQMPGEAIWHAVVGVYASSEETVPIFTVDVIVPFTAEESPFPSLYATLKMAPEFEGAIDC